MINTIHFMNIRNFDLNLLIVFKTLFDEKKMLQEPVKNWNNTTCNEQCS